MKRLLLTLITVILLLSTLHGQEVLSVATQRFEEKIPYRQGMVLKLELEKAQVNVQGWSENYYAFEILLKSKHKNETKAVQELGYLKYTLQENGDTIFFSNDFVSDDKFRRVQGILSLELTIKVPRSSSVVVNNAYGSTTVDNLRSKVALKEKFVKSTIANCEGELLLNAVFGDHQIKNHKGDVILDLTRANLDIASFEGSVIGTTTYGLIRLSKFKLENVNLEGRRTSFTLNLDADWKSYSYDLKSQFGQVLVGEYENDGKNEEWKMDGTSSTFIKIRTTFNDIKINNK